MKQVILLKENPERITCSKTLFNQIQNIKIDYSQENFLVFFLNTQLSLIGTEVLFKGGLNSCVVDPKTIFRKALLKNSCGLIIAHNHPSNELKPSIEDIEVFEELKKCGKILNLEVLDSLTFNETEYYSMNEEVLNDN